MYDPSGWYIKDQIVSKNQYYEVKEMSEKYFHDFVDLSKMLLKTKKLLTTKIILID